MDKVKLARFFGIVKERLQGAEISTTSGMVAYYILLSVFPLLILVGSVLPLAGVQMDAVVPYIELLVPEALQPALESLMQQVLGVSSAGLLSLSAVGLVWSASRSISYVQFGATRAYGLRPRKSYVAKRLLSVAMMLLFGFALGALVLVFSFGDSVLAWLAPYFEWVGWARDLLGDLKWPATLAACVLVLTLLYLIAPEAHVRLRFALPGAVLASGALLGLAQLLAVYVVFATRTLSGYGALSSLFLLLIWLNWSAKILLGGAVLNATVQQYCDDALPPRRVTLLDRTESRVRAWLRRRHAAHERKKDQGPAGK